jgi:hypothetical protein
MTEYNLSPSLQVNGVRHLKQTYKTKMITNRFCLPISRLFSCSVNIAFKVPYEIVIKFYMSNDSFKYYYCLCIWYCTVFSGKLATATGHANKPTMQTLSLVHTGLNSSAIYCILFQQTKHFTHDHRQWQSPILATSVNQALKTCITWPVALAASPLTVL